MTFGGNANSIFPRDRLYSLSITSLSRAAVIRNCTDCSILSTLSFTSSNLQNDGYNYSFKTLNIDVYTEKCGTSIWNTRIYLTFEMNAKTYRQLISCFHPICILQEDLVEVEALRDYLRLQFYLRFHLLNYSPRISQIWVWRLLVLVTCSRVLEE